mmetsp:Transcript_840/g.945  ORF Transcript_840/g.945 Transcript_840/m.945 type:complete len:487 (-) Transcript_840:168-1628(-)
MKLKELLPKIVQFGKDGFGSFRPKFTYQNLSILSDIRGQVTKKVHCVRIVGEVKTGDFVGHDAVMRSRNYASSVIATEACSFYALNRSDLVALLKDQPGIALELQTALALTVSESDRGKVKGRGKENISQFLDEAKLRFSDIERGLTKKQIFSKTILKLARQAKADAALKERGMPKIARNIRQSTMKFLKNKSFQGIIRISSKVGVKVSPKVSTTGEHSAMEHSTRPFLKFKIETKKPSFFSNSNLDLDDDSGEISKKRGLLSKSEVSFFERKTSYPATFLQGMSNMDPANRKMRKMLSDKILRLELFQRKYEAFMDLHGPDNHEHGVLFGSFNTRNRTIGSTDRRFKNGTEEEERDGSYRQKGDNSGVSTIIRTSSYISTYMKKALLSRTNSERKSDTVDLDDGYDLAELKPMKSHRSYTDLYNVSHALDTFIQLTPLIYVPTVTSKKLGSKIVDDSIVVIRRRQSFPSLEGDKLRRLNRTKQIV